MDRTLGVLGGATLAAWLLLLASILMATARPASTNSRRLPVQDAWPVETPALAALLCQPHARVGPIAAEATLLDLSARGYLTVDRVAGSVRVATAIPPGPPTRPALRPYERHVWDRAAASARLGGGITPIDALRLGSAEHTADWHERFVGLVEAEGRERGLVRDRAPLVVRILLYLALFVPLGLLIAATHSLALIPLCVFVTLPFGALVRLFRRPAPRGAGVGAAAACRALVTTRFPGPGDGDRLAAFAVAVDRRHDSPFVQQRQPVVWSAATGSWRQVRVVSGRGVLFGAHPSAALWSIPGVLVFCGIWALILTMGSRQLVVDHARLRFVALVAAGWVLWLTGTALLVRFIGRGLSDLVRPPITIVGPVVFLESNRGSSEDPASYYVAVDDGSGDVVVRHEIGSALHATLRLGTPLRLDLTPSLRAVVRAEIVAGQPYEVRD